MRTYAGACCTASTAITAELSVSCQMARVSMLSSPQTEGNAASLFDGGSDRTYSMRSMRLLLAAGPSL
jgi:hypothetical protein